jgi:plastocyanin
VKRTLAAVIVGAVFVTVAGIGDAMEADSASAEPVLGPGLVTVDVDIQYSRFELDDLRVRPGTTVRFVVRNHDPINHELIVGDAAVHARHEQGTELSHPPVPGEVSVAPHDVGVTFYRFGRPGAYRYACHLPGHVAYGMVGQVTVVDDD